MYVLIIFFVVVIAYYLKYRRSKKLLYELAEELPDTGGLPILGHSHWFLGGPETLMKNIETLASKLESLGNVTKIWIGPQLYIVPFDLDDVQKILENCLEKDYSYKFLRNWLGNGLFVAPVPFDLDDVQKILENCLEKDYSYKFLRNWLGNGLFVAPVQQWKAHRRLLLPVFHNKFTEDYIEVFGQQGEVLVKRFEQLEGQEIEVYEYITSCLLDIVFEAAIGKRMDVQLNPDTPYLRARRTIMSIISMRMFKPWMQPDPLFNLTKHSKVEKESINLTHDFTDEVVIEKRAAVERGDFSNNGRKDILELLLDKNPSFTNQQLREHIDSITIAGNDTTSLVIAYVLVMLGLHRDVQRKVYDELKSIFGDSMRTPTKDDMNKMDYMERVIKETMRLYTVVPVIARTTQSELKLSTCTVPAGVGCGVLPFMIHRSKKVWGEDADEFKPDRFLPENSANRHPCAFIPFSHGTRNCIGRYFGMLAMKSVIANVVRSFEISAKPFDRLKLEILLFPVSGHLITLNKRSK